LARGEALQAAAVNKQGQTALQALQRSSSQEEGERAARAHTATAWLVAHGCPPLEQSPKAIVAPPTFFSGYTYVHLAFLAQRFSSGSGSGTAAAAALAAPGAASLLIEVEAEKLQLEPAQRVAAPLRTLPSSHGLFWGAEWHLQNPLENVDDAAAVVIKLQGSSARLSLSKKTIDSGLVTLVFSATPTPGLGELEVLVSLRRL